jgi:hypothetical protein
MVFNAQIRENRQMVCFQKIECVIFISIYRFENPISLNKCFHHAVVRKKKSRESRYASFDSQVLY